MLKNIDAAIFDLDGTLIDSMWVWNKIDTDYLTSKNIEVPENLEEDLGHLSFIQTAEYFKKRFEIEDSIEEICNTWNTMAQNHYSNDIPLKPGVAEFLSFLKSQGIKIGLATSNSTHLLEASLKNHGIYDLFDAITITDEVGIGKHRPDVYLLAAKKLNADPLKCVVFEDILPAIKGAKLGGMKVVAIEDEASINDRDTIINEANLYIKDYNELLSEIQITA